MLSKELSKQAVSLQIRYYCYKKFLSNIAGVMLTGRFICK
jgi:hypothetical protein